VTDPRSFVDRKRGTWLFVARDPRGDVKRVVVAVVLLVLLSGCNAFGTTAERTPAETVTAAPVPTAGTVATATGTPGNCVSPKPAAAPVSTPQPRTDPIELTGASGTVDGRTLSARHGRTLSNYSFHLRAGTSGEVWSLPGGAAFTYQGSGLGVGAPWAYAVGGQLYTLRTDEGQLVFDEREYGRDSPTRERLSPVLTGERWLAGQIGAYNYSVVDTREYNGTTVRVLEDTTTEEGLVVRPSVRAGALLFVNSTVYVDAHGVVRYVRHVEHLRYGPGTGIPNRTTVGTFTVDQVGTAGIHRPAAFCVTNPDAMRTAGPEFGPNPTVVGSSIDEPRTAGPDTTASTVTAPVNGSTATPDGTSADTPS